MKCDASEGVTYSLCFFVGLKECLSDAIVITNSLIAFKSVVNWDSENNKSAIYLWNENSKRFVSIHELTTRVIKPGHNIERLYLAGEFDTNDYTVLDEAENI